VECSNVAEKGQNKSFFLLQEEQNGWGAIGGTNSGDEWSNDILTIGAVKIW
jgi:hypothetical protein